MAIAPRLREGEVELITYYLLIMFLGAVRNGPGESADKGEGGDEQDPLDGVLEPCPALIPLQLLILRPLRGGASDGGTAGAARADVHGLLLITVLILLLLILLLKQMEGRH